MAFICNCGAVKLSGAVKAARVAAADRRLSGSAPHHSDPIHLLYDRLSRAFRSVHAHRLRDFMIHHEYCCVWDITTSLNMNCCASRVCRLSSDIERFFYVRIVLIRTISRCVLHVVSSDTSVTNEDVWDSTYERTVGMQLVRAALSDKQHVRLTGIVQNNRGTNTLVNN
ncbi:hypothetical protein EXN66_Car018239 [Channa argus]|uniref:Uncharacterized protein n=1 Tax=Channa argus TaxID=215402 RepID=A0A6G1QIP8_CHAAH|nr:hypothetical protein EXN66_Car018239 [Channa argus]